MNKTQNEILTDIWKVVTANTSIAALDGGIYKRTRPTGSELQDCVINVINGTNGKHELNSALYVKIFYKDIRINDMWVEDATKGQTNEGLLQSLSETLLKLKDYVFYVETRETYTEAVPEIKQHYAILKMNFKLTL